MKIKILLLLLFSTYGISQEYRKLTIRGKVLASLIAEDDNTYTGTVGLEYEFIKNHSIGADFIYIGNLQEFDTFDDLNTGIYKTTKSFIYLVDYRYYIKPAFLKETYSTFYVSAYYKNIAKDFKNDPEVQFFKNDRTWGNYKYNDLGTALGFRFSFNPDNDNFGLDTNLGISYRMKNEDYTLYIDENTPNKIFENEKSNQWLPSIRVNLYYKFW